MEYHIGAFIFAGSFAGTVLVLGGHLMRKHIRSLLEANRRRHALGMRSIRGGYKNKRRTRLRLRLPFWTIWPIKLLSLLLLLFILRYLILALDISSSSNPASRNHAQNGLIDVFQVYQQPAGPSPNQSHCSILLMDHVFAFSYGKPFVGSYQPPKACPFNSVLMTLTVTSRGRQFDRLALMFLGDVEVFRSSTAEPTANGIRWIYRKDMTPYLSLWRAPQKLIFDLGNLVDETYTGTFNATLTATFFKVDKPPQTADLILPISSRRSKVGAPSAFSLPVDNATIGHTLPAGVSKALASISACGQATEEFWYSNVLSQDTDTFVNTTGPLYGVSPFREIQLLIDGYLAGVIWPFPVIFTGGIAPGFWRPIVGIDAFDLREPEVDITPWVPWLSDGQEHEFQIKVLGLDGEGENVSLSSAVGDYWVVTGKILVFLASEQSNTRNPDGHSVPSIFAPNPVISAKSSIEQSANGTNETLSYSVTASRNVVVTSEAGSWVQNLDFRNDNVLTSKGLTQYTTQDTKANFAAINFRDPRSSFSLAFSYPLSVNTTIGLIEDTSGISIQASLSRGLAIDSTGRLDHSLFTLTPCESKLETVQLGTAHYSSEPNRSYSYGHTTQDFSQSSQQGVTVVHVEAVNGSFAFTDGVAVQGITKDGDMRLVPPLPETDPPYHSLRDMLGRGPGKQSAARLSQQPVQ